MDQCLRRVILSLFFLTPPTGKGLGTLIANLFDWGLRERCLSSLPGSIPRLHARLSLDRL